MYLNPGTSGVIILLLSKILFMNMKNNFSIFVTEQRTVTLDMTRTLNSAPQVSVEHSVIVLVSKAPVSARASYVFHFGETSVWKIQLCCAQRQITDNVLNSLRKP